ncbi:hypothetical protein C8R46DRAFT_1107194 [Mycena filopes]|nr:hypothetical protein C8R46DRAFT_1107194 [Mycena filopes]
MIPPMPASSNNNNLTSGTTDLNTEQFKNSTTTSGFNDYGRTQVGDNTGDTTGAGGVRFDGNTGEGMGAGVGPGSASSNTYGSGVATRFDGNTGEGMGAGTDGVPAAVPPTSSSGAADKPPHATMGDKIKGSAEKVLGKATKNPGIVEMGEQRKEGLN